MEIDLYGMELYEALEEIAYCLEESKAIGTTELKLIHGYHGKAVLKNYITSRGFIKDMSKEGFDIQILESSNPGSTTFKIK